MNKPIPASRLWPRDPAKFRNRYQTADGSQRASVSLRQLETLWLNTGTQCNIECAHCYIESSPHNDRLSYIRLAEVIPYLDEISERGLGTREIGLTGGEPFLNPDCVEIISTCLQRGFEVLVLTNAMKPLMRPKVQAALSSLQNSDRLTFRVSLDHYSAERHDDERGEGAWNRSMAGVRWLRDQGFRIHVAGRMRWGESEPELRAGYASLFARESLNIVAENPAQLVLFPEMDENADVPEITVDCWGILGKKPDDIMCASSRMLVKRKGAEAPTVLACTLLAYDQEFELGATLADAGGDVHLNHPHCAKFCVLGGASCSA